MCRARFLIEMERLGIKLGAKSLDSLLVDLQPAGAKGLPDCKVFEISSASHIHCSPSRTSFVFLVNLVNRVEIIRKPLREESSF